MLTTAGVARATASAYDTGPWSAAAFTGACAGTAAVRGAPRSHSGRSVVTMNKMPRQTVTVWAKTNHKRCIDPKGTRNESGFHPTACRMARHHVTDAAHQRLLPQRASSGGAGHDTAYYYRSDGLPGTA